MSSPSRHGRSVRKPATSDATQNLTSAPAETKQPAPAPKLSTEPEALIARVLAGRWFLLMIALAGLVILALASIPAPVTKIAIEIRTRTLTVRTDPTGGAAVLAADRPGAIGVRLRPSSQIILSGAFVQLPEAVDAALPATARAAGSLAITVDEGRLAALGTEPGAWLTLEIQSDNSLVYSAPSGASAQLSLRGTVNVSPSVSSVAPIILSQAETVILATAAGFALRVLVHPVDPKQTGIEDLAISEVRFSRPRLAADARPPFRSQIMEGSTLRLLDVGKTLQVRAGDSVWLECFDALPTWQDSWNAPHLWPLIAIGAALDASRGRGCFQGYLARVRVDGGDLVADIVGTVGQVALGPLIAKQDVTPSLLAYLQAQEGLKLLWLAALPVFLFFWKAREWARGFLKAASSK